MPRTRNPYPADFREQLVALPLLDRTLYLCGQRFKEAAFFTLSHCPKPRFGAHESALDHLPTTFAERLRLWRLVRLHAGIHIGRRVRVLQN